MKRPLIALLVLSATLWLAACATSGQSAAYPAGNGAQPAATAPSNAKPGEISSVEREQIQNVVRAYLTQQPNASQFQVTVDKTEGDWARVLARPSGTSSSDMIVYVHRSNAPSPAGAPSLAPTAGPTPSSPSQNPALTPLSQNPPPPFGSTPALQTSSGWTIALGPKLSYSTQELNSAGVPQDLWPKGDEGQPTPGTK